LCDSQIFEQAELPEKRRFGIVSMSERHHWPGPPMDLRQLRYFCEVAKARSFRLASRALNVSQSSLSRRVAELEAALGEALLSRNARGVSLTAEGHKFQAQAEALLKDFETLGQNKLNRPSPAPTTITLGMPSSISRLVLAQLVTQIHAESASVRLKFVEGAQYELLEGLDSGHVDLAVMNSPEPMANYSAELLWSEPLHFVSQGDRQRSNRKVQLAQILNGPFAMFPRPSGHRNYLDKRAREAGGRFDVRYEISNTATQKNFVRFGLARCLLPASAVMTDMSGLNARPVLGLELRRVLVARSDRTMGPEAGAIATLIRSEGRRMVKRIDAKKASSI
jgi:LysR family nitrogen assimilation transcriptional regulator